MSAHHAPLTAKGSRQWFQFAVGRAASVTTRIHVTAITPDSCTIVRLSSIVGPTSAPGGMAATPKHEFFNERNAQQ